ncbi:MAG: helix-turn-helix domain-containing protein [Cyanobacteria bacterium J06631_2]
MVKLVTQAIKRLGNLMASAINRFKNWLSDQRNFLFSRYTKDGQETQEPERSLIELPTAVRKKLIEQVEDLPSNLANQKAIASTLEEAYEIWRENPTNSNNSLVILSSPVTAVSRILSETLEEWTEQRQIALKLLPFKYRPGELKEIKSKLEHHLCQDPAQNEDERPLEIVVIPNLSWCFLRSLEGLEGIEYLQSLLCDSSHNRFWIIGSGQVGWQYLNSVCALEAYCGSVFVLPPLDSEQLESWLDPIVDDLDLAFDTPRIEQKILDGDQDNRRSYFNRLADISKGVATVAVQAFLKSISCIEEKEQKTEKQDQKQDNDPQPKSLIAQTPKLPKLANLSPADRYLLYSLLLHGDLTIAALTESLGDDKSEVQATVQLLRREGIVEQRDNVLKINPIYYPKVKQELASNNFIINRN